MNITRVYLLWRRASKLFGGIALLLEFPSERLTLSSLMVSSLIRKDKQNAHTLRSTENVGDVQWLGLQ